MGLYPTPHKNKQGNRMPIHGLISDSKQINTNKTLRRQKKQKRWTNTHSKKQEATQLKQQININPSEQASHSIYKQEAQTNGWALVKRGHINLDKQAKTVGVC